MSLDFDLLPCRIPATFMVAGKPPRRLSGAPGVAGRGVFLFIGGDDIIIHVIDGKRTYRANASQAVGGSVVDIVTPCKWKHPYLADGEWARVCIEAWSAEADKRGLVVQKVECGDCYIHIALCFPAYTTVTVSNFVTGAKKAAKAAIRERFGPSVFSKTAGSFFARTFIASSVGEGLGDEQIVSYLDDVRIQYSDKPYG